MKVLGVALVCLLVSGATAGRRERSVRAILNKYHWKQHLLMVFTNGLLNQRYLHQVLNNHSHPLPFWSDRGPI